MASTVLTRASNVIPIAYIPGVTNRSPPDSPDVLVPPVPSMAGSTGSNNDSNNNSYNNNYSQNYSQDQHYFLPGDIRDSVWSQMTDEQRKSISPSLARSSVATTIYRNNAIVSPVPAQQAMRAKPAMVSVKSGQNSPSSTPGSQTPAVPSITDSQLDKAHAVGAQLEKEKEQEKEKEAENKTTAASPIVARSGFARPVNVSKPKAKPSPSTITEGGSHSGGSERSVPTVTVESTSESKSSDTDKGKDKEKARTSEPPVLQGTLAGHQQALRHASASGASGTMPDDSPAMLRQSQSPFADPRSPTTTPTPQQIQIQSPTTHSPPPPLGSPSPSGSSSAIPEEMSHNPSPQLVDAKRGSQSGTSSSPGSGSGSHRRHRSSQHSGGGGGSRLSQKNANNQNTKRSASPFSDENEVR